MSEPFDFEAAKPKLAMAEPRQGASLTIPTQADTEPHLLDYVKVVYKRRWLVGTAFVIVLLAVMVYTFTATPVYEGRVELLIESDNPNVVSFKEVIDEGQAKADYYQTQYKLLQSRTLAKRTIDTQKLWNREEFGGGGASARNGFLQGAAVQAWQSVTGLFGGSAPKTTEAPTADETAEQARFITAFLQHLQVNPVRNSRLVDVTFRSSDPRLAADVVNTLAKGYIDQTLEYKFTSSKEASDWLSARLAEQRQKVEASELALQQYREQNDALSLEQKQDITVQKLSDLNSAVTKAKTERLEKEALYMQLRAVSRDRAQIDTFPAILANGFIQQQKAELASLQRQLASASEKFGDKHPEIIRIKSSIDTTEAKLQGEIAKVVQSVRNEYLAAQAQETSLVSALSQQKNEALSMNRKGIEYGVLQRDAESNRQIYDSLLQRAKETGVSGELKTSNIRVVDAAETPISPVSPKRTLNLFIGLFGGLFFGVGLAFFFEYLDNRLKTPDQIRQYLGIAPLGLIPALRKQDTEPLVNRRVPANFSEAFRTVRTNVLFSSAAEGPRSIVVTSTGPGEGKTMVAANLAIGFAQTGQRVLLIDADMRRPRVHDVLGLTQEPGLSNLMVGNAKTAESVRKTAVGNLWVLPAGRIPPNPAELLGSPRFREFIKSLTEHFSWVIVDSPPVMAVADSSIVANLVSGVVFVVGSDMTSRHGAKAALDQLENARAKFVGAILNRVDIEGNPYYYSQYYRREYARYYVKTGTR